jgi:hypothetical protein
VRTPDADLAARVRDAFRMVPRPAALTFSSPAEDRESAIVTAIYQQKHWSNLTPDVVGQWPSAVSFLSAEAFRFFLPGFLLLALHNLDDLDVALLGLLGRLTGPDNEDILTHMEEKQLAATLAVLEKVAPTSEEDPVYWDFQRAQNEVLDRLTRPSGGGVRRVLGGG